MEAGNGIEGERDGYDGVSRDGCLSGFIDSGSRESHRLFLSRRTVLEMLRDRGYAVSVSEINLSLQEFRAIYGQEPDVDRLRISIAHQSHPSKRMLVIFCGPGIVKVNVIRSLATQIVNKDSLTGLILILQNQITNQALKAVDLFSFKVEIFQITDLLVNITKHVLKPKHRVLTDQEKDRLLKKFSIEEKQTTITILSSGGNKENRPVLREMKFLIRMVTFRNNYCSLLKYRCNTLPLYWLRLILFEEAGSFLEC